MKIYISKEPIDTMLGVVRHCDLPFHIEKDKWTIVDTIEEADVIPLTRPPIIQNFRNIDINITTQDQLAILREKARGKTILIMMHTHMSESYGLNFVNMVTEPYKEITDKVFVVDINYIPDDNPNHIFYDFCLVFNKIYFTEYNKYSLKDDRLWTSNCNESSFALRNIEPLNPKRKFLVPNNVRAGTGEFKEFARAELRKITSDDDCYFSDLQRGIFLDPEEPGLQNCYTEMGTGFIPIANKYYEDSVVSVYVETVGGSNLVKNSAGGVTEKTFSAFLKGHIILPFSVTGFVQYLKTQYGFKFPKWIDYRYDSIYDDNLRLQSYLRAVEELKRLPLDNLAKLANRDIEIRQHNKQLMYDLSYDSLYDKVKARINN